MSGGVDSSVVAALLSEMDVDLRAVYMRNWSTMDEQGAMQAGSGGAMGCEWQREWDDVQRVCRHLGGIPVELVDLSREYWVDVFEPAIGQWSDGTTPNPDVTCNRYVAQLTQRHQVWRTDGKGASSEPRHTRMSRDRALCAYRLPHAERRTDAIYPACDRSVQGPVVLPVVGAVGAAAQCVLSAGIDAQGGRTCDCTPPCFAYCREPGEHGAVLCRGAGCRCACLCAVPRQLSREHSGAPPCAGRRGARPAPGPALAHDRAARAHRRTPRALLCCAKRRQGKYHDGGPGQVRTPLLTRSHPMLQCLWLTTDTFHWAADAPALPMPCSAQVRYRQAAAPCVAHDAGHGKVRVDFHEPMLAVAAGQAVALYDDDVCLGSATIEHVHTADSVH